LSGRAQRPVHPGASLGQFGIGEAADDYWATTREYWAGVRVAWEAAIARGRGVKVVEEAETGSASGARLMGFADQVQVGKLATAAAIVKAQAVIAEVTRSSAPAG